jgi:glutamate-5-semialdehyde dehydrogenase
MSQHDSELSPHSSESVELVARRARAAALELAGCATATKNQALQAMRDALVRRREAVLEANRQDMEEAAKLVEAGTMTQAMRKRLDLSGTKYDAMLAGLDDLLELPDPVGSVDYAVRLDEGLDLRRVSCPLGVIGVIFEARPDAAVQISALTLKSANAVILKGGREADRSNRALVQAMREGIKTVSAVPVDAVQLIATREEVKAMLDLDSWIDLIIPRGSNELVQAIQEGTRIPVLGHADGICSVYVDRDADLDKAISVVLDAKTQYPAVCNAAETLLVHRDALPRVLPELGKRLEGKGVELRADSACSAHLPTARAATPEDFRTEFLDLVLAVKAVDSIEEAVAHINSHGSHHTDAIVTESEEAARYFLARVDSAGVFHNASTRFADGFRFGLGAEVGVSTNKTHARGPVGMEGLVIYKYQLRGAGQGVEEYGPEKKPFLHTPLPAEQPADEP